MTKEEKAATKAAKEAETAVEVVETAPKVVLERKSERQARWDAFLEKHKAQNPEKHGARLKAGELEMPDNV